MNVRVREDEVKGEDGEWQETEEQSLNAQPELIRGEWIYSVK